MKTLDDLKNSCRIEIDADGGEHWIMTGPDPKYTPYVKAPSRALKGAMAKMPARRFSWQEQNGRAPRRGWMVICTCEFEGCVKCVREIGKSAFERQKGRSPEAKQRHHESMVRSWDGKRKVTMEIAVDMLTTAASHHAMARKHGVDKNTVILVRTGQHSVGRAAARQAMGMFSQLLS